MMTTNTRQEIEDEAALGFNLLGYTVVFSCKGIEVDTTTIEELLTPLDWKQYLPLVRPHTRLKRAIMRWMKEQVSGNSDAFGLDERDEKRMLREITKGSTAEMIVYAIVN